MEPMNHTAHHEDEEATGYVAVTGDLAKYFTELHTESSLG